MQACDNSRCAAHRPRRSHRAVPHRRRRHLAARADGGGDDKPAPPRDPKKEDDLLAFQDVPLPLARPQVSYFLLAANLSVYAAGIAIALADSNEASNDFFLLLAKQNAEVRRQGSGGAFSVGARMHALALI